MADDAGSDEGERKAELRHFVRNRLAAVRNAAFYLQRRTETTALWHEDPRVAKFFALIVHELGQIEEAVSGNRVPGVTDTQDATPATARAGARVLVVDDHDGNRETLAALLADEDFAVDQVATLADALTYLESDASLDAILLDRHLGEHDGLVLVPLVRATRPAAKIVIVSGACSEAMEGVDDVVGKDLGFEVLLSRLRKLLEPT